MSSVILLYWPYYSVEYWTCEHVCILYFWVHYIPSVILFLGYIIQQFYYYGYIPSVTLLYSYWSYYSVQYWTCEHVPRIYFRFSRFIWFLQLFYYLGHIIVLSIELENMSIFQDHEVCHSSAVILLLFILLLNAIWILLARVHFRFLSFITLQKLIINGNLCIIAYYTCFIIH
jgi:hypothetical protein